MKYAYGNEELDVSILAHAKQSEHAYNQLSR